MPYSHEVKDSGPVRLGTLLCHVTKKKRVFAVQDGQRMERIQKRVIHLLSQNAEEALAQKLSAQLPVPSSSHTFHPAKKCLGLRIHTKHANLGMWTKWTQHAVCLQGRAGAEE
jgi:hypothetical protein